jgi:hypothetical protein
MPRTNIDYSKTIIYKLCCRDINITEIYVGHTTDMRKRKNNHKSRCNNEKDKRHNLNVYQFIRDNGGWDNFDMIEIERYNAIDGNDAKKRERYWIEELKATLNIVIPTRTDKEWQKDNKEILAEKRNQYYNSNKENILEEAKINYKHNKEIIINNVKEYYEKNKKIITEKNKEKITCECGCLIRKNDLTRHKKTKKHIELMSMKEGLL